jgi:hypothetical protein
MNDGGLCVCALVYDDLQCDRVRVQSFIMILGGI